MGLCSLVGRYLGCDEPQGADVPKDSARLRKGRDLSDLVERMAPMEERATVSISNIGAYVTYEGTDDVRCLSVAGEVQSLLGNKVGQRITIVVTVYDADGRVIATLDKKYRLDAPFETFSMGHYELKLSPDASPAKIRVYPKARQP
jgi:hypothetical protein